MSVSVVIPGIRSKSWAETYEKIKLSCDGVDFEVVFISPEKELPEELRGVENVRLIQDFGSPSRALQIGFVNASKKYVMWLCDDVEYIHANVIANEVKRLDLFESELFIVNFIYTEGPAYLSRADDRINRPNLWYHARYHDDLKLPGIDDKWYIAPIFLMHTSKLLELGGIDCRYETINLNLHDLMFRAQKDGCKLVFSSQVLVHLSWQNGKENNRENVCPIYKAYFDNDLPLFKEQYSQPLNETRIPLNNWMLEPELWERRWAQNNIPS